MTAATFKITQAGYPRGDREVAWLAANQVDLERVRSWQDVVVDDDAITLTMFDLDPEGNKVVAGPGHERYFAQRSVMVPLLVPPKDFGLA